MYSQGTYHTSTSTTPTDDEGEDLYSEWFVRTPTRHLTLNPAPEPPQSDDEDLQQLDVMEQGEELMDYERNIEQQAYHQPQHFYGDDDQQQQLYVLRQDGEFMDVEDNYGQGSHQSELVYIHPNNEQQQQEVPQRYNNGVVYDEAAYGRRADLDVPLNQEIYGATSQDPHEQNNPNPADNSNWQLVEQPGSELENYDNDPNMPYASEDVHYGHEDREVIQDKTIYKATDQGPYEQNNLNPTGDFNPQFVEQWDYQLGIYENDPNMPHASAPQSSGNLIASASGPIRRKSHSFHAKLGNPEFFLTSGRLETFDPLWEKRKSRKNGQKEVPDASSRNLQLMEGDNIFIENVNKRICFEMFEMDIALSVVANNVLGLKQCTFSKMLNHPPKSLQKKGKSHYHKMIFWINLSEEKKRKVLAGKLMIVEAEQDAEPVPEPQPEKEREEEVEASNAEKTKKRRTKFTPEQKETLLASFNVNPIPRKDGQERLAKELDLPSGTVMHWFNNNRRRGKKNTAKQ